jgi:hypothetical protein
MLADVALRKRCTWAIWSVGRVAGIRDRQRMHSHRICMKRAQELKNPWRPINVIFNRVLGQSGQDQIIVDHARRSFFVRVPPTKLLVSTVEPAQASLCAFGRLRRQPSTLI